MIDFDIPAYIPRPIYVRQLEPLVGKDVIKVLVGQRRVGKSYLLYHVVDMIRKRDPACPVLYVNKELAAFDDIRTHSDLLDLTMRQLGSAPRGCILIDEVHEIENWSRARCAAWRRRSGSTSIAPAATRRCCPATSPPCWPAAPSKCRCAACPMESS